MKFKLEIVMTNSEGVLERILGRLRQRNVHLQNMAANCATDLSTIEAKITVESSRSAESIMKQISKLYDVQYINVIYLDPEEKFNHDEQRSQTIMPRLLQTRLGEQNELCLSI